MDANRSQRPSPGCNDTVGRRGCRIRRLSITADNGARRYRRGRAAGAKDVADDGFCNHRTQQCVRPEPGAPSNATRATGRATLQSTLTSEQVSGENWSGTCSSPIGTGRENASSTYAQPRNTTAGMSPNRVAAGVLVLGGVATADLATGQAQPQAHPAVAEHSGQTRSSVASTWI